jgi:hypothetical protein
MPITLHPQIRVHAHTGPRYLDEALVRRHNPRAQPIPETFDPQAAGREMARLRTWGDNLEFPPVPCQ